jgi:hypothetical protein
VTMAGADLQRFAASGDRECTTCAGSGSDGHGLVE